MNRKLLLLFLLLFGAVSSGALAQSSPENAYFKDGEKVNFIGNSITHGGQFHNYLMLYYATRFPGQTVTFYNSGIWGDNANSFLKRMDADILSKPADYSVVMAGMNDVNRALYDPAKQTEPDIETRKARALSDYKGYLEQVIKKLQAANTKVILQKPTIYDQTGTLSAANMPGVNDALYKATLIMDELAQKYSLKTVDYYTLMNTINTQLQTSNPSATVVSNDRIHPGAPGHLIMAYQFLKETDAPTYVSNTEIANGNVTRCDNCTTREVVSENGKLSFKLKAGSLPYPVEPAAEAALAWVPFTAEFNQELLKVSGLAAGKYTLAIDGSEVAEFTQEQLHEGVNLALLKNTPQYKQALKVQEQTTLYRATQMKLRDIKLMEFNYLPTDLLGKPFTEIQTYINSLISSNDSKYTSNKARFDAYLVNKPNEATMEQQLVSIAALIPTLNQPVEHTYTLSRSYQKQTHVWEFDEPVVNGRIQGWQIINYNPATSENGILKLYGTVANNNITYNKDASDAKAGPIDPTVSKVAVIRLKNETVNKKARFYFWTLEPTVNAAFIEFDITANDTQFKEYTIDLSKDSRWAGIIRIIRFDVPSPLSNTEYSKAVSIDYVKLLTYPEMPERGAAPFGVNLAGAEFGSNMPGVFNTDYTYPTAQELDYFKAKGLTLFRLPFKWERIQPVLGGALDEAELARMKTFVEAARVRGLWVLLDMHNYGRRKINGTEFIIGSPELTIQHVTDAWGKLATEFKDYDNIWGYGLMNEPQGMLASTPWFNIAQALITKIREIDTETPIVVGGDSWSSAARWLTASDNLKNLADPSNKLVFEAHVYFDKDASGKYANSYEAEGATAQTGVERLTPFVTWLKENKLKGFVGEYGVPENDTRWLVTLETMLDYMAENCLNGTYWAAGPWWNTYTLAVEPIAGADRPQMATLAKYQFTDGGCSLVTGMAWKEFASGLKAYPNPVADQLFLDLDKMSGHVSVEIIDVWGKPVLSKSFGTTNSVQLNLGALSPGVYLVQVTGTTISSVVRIVKQ